MTRDPRDARRLSARDIEALIFIGEGYEVAQYQLHRAVFSGVSAVMVSRFVGRMREAGYIAVERWNHVGINRLQLTANGRNALVQRGVPEESLFVPRRPVATKDLSHTLAINDLRGQRLRVRRYPSGVPEHPESLAAAG